MSVERWTLALGLAGVVALVITPLASQRSRFARRFGLGSAAGIAAAIAVCLPMLGGADAPLVIGVLGALWLFAAGVMLDRGMLPRQLGRVPVALATIAVTAAGLRVHLTGFEEGDAVATALIVYAATSAWRSTPSRDGMLLGWAIAISAGAGALGGLAGQSACAAVGAGLAGASLGFLAWWLPPTAARLRAGGAALVGFLAVVLALDARPSLGSPRDGLIPLMLLALPLLDATFVATARLRGRRLDPLESGLSGRLRALHLGRVASGIVLVTLELALAGLAFFAGRGVVSLEIAIGATVAAVTLVTLACLRARLDGPRGRWSRRLVLLGAGIVIGIVILSAPAAIALIRARAAASDGAAATRAGLAAAHRGESVAAASAFAAAENDFIDARRKLRDPFAAGGLAVPLLAPNLHAARELADVGLTLARTGKTLATTADPQQLKIRDGTVNLTELAVLRPAIENTADSLDQANKELRAVDRSFVVPQVDDAIAKLERRLSKAVHDSRLAADAARLLPPVLGGTGPRRYFLAVQNNAEARAPGGFVGSWGIITALNGKLDLGDVHSVGRLDAQTPLDRRTLHAPDDYRKRYARFLPERIWQNINMSPDIPTDAAVMADTAPQSGAGPVDGVVTIDPVGLKHVLELTGPILVPPWPVAITAQNILDIVLKEEYSFFENDPQGRDDFIGDVAKEAWDKFTDGDIGNPARVLKALGRASHEKHLVVWLKDPEAQDLLHTAHADAAFPPPGDDLSMVTTQNAGANKLDVYLQRRLRYTVHLDPSADRNSADVRARIEATFKNTAPSAGQPQYVLGPNAPGVGPGVNRTFFTIYSPLQRGPSALDGQPLGLETLRELGYWASSTYLDIPPGGSHAVSMDLSGRLRLGPNGRYRLHLVRQALAAPDDVEVTVDVPAGWHLVPRGGLVVAPDGRHARYRAKVDRDRILDADIERDPHGSLLDRIEAGHG